VQLPVDSGSTSRRSGARRRGKKAFIVNRIGDFGFLLAIFLAFKVFGTVDIAGIEGLLKADAGEVRGGGDADRASAVRGGDREVGAAARCTCGCRTRWRGRRRCRR